MTREALAPANPKRALDARLHEDTTETPDTSANNEEKKSQKKMYHKDVGIV